MNVNYSNSDGRPVKKGRMQDVIKPKKRLFSRHTSSSRSETINELKLDLVRVLADLGIVLSNIHTIASKLVDMGWIKTKKIEKDV